MKGNTPLKVLSQKDLEGKNLENPNVLLNKPIRISRIKDAKRLLSRLIFEFQKGTINGRDAKDLTYLLISYVTICKAIDFEERLIKLEEKFNAKS